MSINTIIAGAGDLGGRVAAGLCNAGHHVTTLSRSGREIPGDAHSLKADLSTGEGLGKLPRQADALVFCVAPDERTQSAYRALYVDGLRRMLEQCEFDRVIFVSSSAVYAQNAGEWVDEQSPALADTFNGHILRQAELVCEQHRQATALRFTGIYGPGRNRMLNRARAGETGQAHWTNRIHVEDGAAAIVHVLGLLSPSPYYCVNDDCPAPESELLDWLRAPERPIQTAPDYVASGRRVRNRLLRATGWQPKYPSYREGYRPLVDAAGV